MSADEFLAIEYAILPILVFERPAADIDLCIISIL
jgi:hypothetical protein